MILLLIFFGLSFGQAQADVVVNIVHPKKPIVQANPQTKSQFNNVLTKNDYQDSGFAGAGIQTSQALELESANQTQTFDATVSTHHISSYKNIAMNYKGNINVGYEKNSKQKNYYLVGANAELDGYLQVANTKKCQVLPFGFGVGLASKVGLAQDNDVLVKGNFNLNAGVLGMHCRLDSQTQLIVIPQANFQTGFGNNYVNGIDLLAGGKLVVVGQNDLSFTLNGGKRVAGPSKQDLESKKNNLDVESVDYQFNLNAEKKIIPGFPLALGVYGEYARTEKIFDGKENKLVDANTNAKTSMQLGASMKVVF